MKVQAEYFEKQGVISSECGVCSLNNLIGYKIFTSKKLTKISQQLASSPFNEYKSIVGGDYDVTVLITALQSIQLSARWLKNNQNIEDALDNKLVKGVLINQKLDSFWNNLNKLLDLSGRHWTCVKKYEDFFIGYDSKKSQSNLFKDKKQVCVFLQNKRKAGATILVVYVQKQQ